MYPVAMTTWRDLTDQLAPQQCAELESLERNGCPPDRMMLIRPLLRRTQL
jgi:hypothetical protein